MRVLQLIHWEPKFEYNCSGYFARRGDRVDNAQLFKGGPAPEPEDYDALIVYGGYMSAFDDSGHPWIKDELRFLESCLKAGLPVLGICLGSQLLARLLGARIYKSDFPEFGFKRLELTEEGAADPALGRLAGPGGRGFLALEWHNDAWDLPAGAVRLARSEAWENQAFRYGPKVLATQFHLEFTQPHMAAGVAANSGELPADPAAEAPEAFVAPGPRWEEIRLNMERLLDGFLEGAR